MASSSDDMENVCGEGVASKGEGGTSQKRVKIKHSKICGVCGDRALGFNFNAVTCESCKAFFRRNAFKDSQIRCLFKGNCVIDLKTRRFCPSCRIKKCYEVGMKKDMILDDTERKARMAKVIRNRAKKQPALTHNTANTESTDPDEFYAESSDISSPSSSDAVKSPSVADTSSLGSAEKLFQQIPPERFPTDPKFYRQLTDREEGLLQDIANCYETTIAALPDLDFCHPENYRNANDLVNNTEICVRQLIKFVKHLDDFCSLCKDDQIAALKGSIMKSQLLRSVAFYIMDRDAWLTQKGEIPTSILREATGFSSLHNLHVSYCRTLKSVVLNNFKLYALMQVLVIFHPDSAGLVDREKMSNLQDKYIGLLKHYLESKYSFEFAQEYFVAVMAKLAQLKDLSDEHSRILLQVNPSQVEPLMLEVLNLK